MNSGESRDRFYCSTSDENQQFLLRLSSAVSVWLQPHADDLNRN